MNYLVPQYLTLDYIKGFIGDKVAFTIDPVLFPDAILEAVANDLIAKAEGDVQYEFLNHFAFPTPAQYTALSSTFPITYSTLTDLLTAKAIAKILSFYYGMVGESKGSDFIKYANEQYAFILNRLLRKLDNGLYAYINLPGLAINPLAVIRKTTGRSLEGLIGGQNQFMANYATGQILNPEVSFANTGLTSPWLPEPWYWEWPCP